MLCDFTWNDLNMILDGLSKLPDRYKREAMPEFVAPICETSIKERLMEKTIKYLGDYDKK